MSTVAHNYQKEAKPASFARFAGWISRFPLVIATFLFTAIASKFLFDPVHSAAMQGVSLVSGLGITTARIGFGAFPLAFAVITLSCLVSRSRLLTGIYIVLTVFSVVLLVRVFGMIADNSVKENIHVLVPEIVLTLISGVALKVELRSRRLAPNTEAAG